MRSWFREGYDIILIAFFWITRNGVRNEGNVKPQT